MEISVIQLGLIVLYGFLLILRRIQQCSEPTNL